MLIAGVLSLVFIPAVLGLSFILRRYPLAG